MVRAVGGRIRVLHVDDDPGVTELAAEYLEREDDRLTVLTSDDPETALETLAEESVDCVVTDYRMPGMDGIELLEAVHDRYPDLPVVLFTGEDREDVATDAVDAGAAGFVPKGTLSEEFSLLAHRIVDAVERYRTRRALAATTRRVETLATDATEAVAVLDDAGRVEYASPAAERLLGTAPESLVGETVLDRIHPEDRPAVDCPPSEGQSSGRVRVETADGDYEDVHFRLRDRRDDPDVAGVVVYARRDDPPGGWPESRESGGEDATDDRDRADEGDPEPADGPDAVSGKEPAGDDGGGSTGDSDDREGDSGEVTDGGAKTRGGGDRSPRPSGTGPPDDDGTRLEDLHRRAARLQACSTREEVYDEAIAAAVDILEFDWCGLSVVDGDYFRLRAVSPDAPVSAGERILGIDEGAAGEAYATGESILTEDSHSDDTAAPTDPAFRAGITVPVGDLGVFQPVADEPGGFDREDLRMAELLCLHVEEAIERVDRERELARQNERLDEFASVVSHDLRNPLEVARAELELARRGDEEAFDRVETAHERMEELIDDVLTFARRGQSVEDVESVDLAHVARESWGTVVTGEASLEVEGSTVVEADRSRLRDLLENLFRNSVEHGSTGSRPVTVRVGPLEGGDGFYVADDGVGVPEDDRETVFESGYSTDEDNTGFGLAIVEEIAEAHDWTVSVTDSEDGGARFEVRTGDGRE